MNRPARFDLHVHTRHSPDSRLALRGAVVGMDLVGLSGLAVTDHNSVAALTELRELQREFPQRILLPGVEVSAREGHVLVYGVTELPARDVPVAELVEWSDARNGVAVLAHPLRRVHGVGRTVAESVQGVGVEACNGRNSSGQNDAAARIASERQLWTTGGSDAHELPSLGRAFTELSEPVVDANELLDALRKGRARAGGRSLSTGQRTRLALRNAGLRFGRGLRPV
jgi:predicted metal-dependent phosphoesterase TrpH